MGWNPQIDAALAAAVAEQEKKKAASQQQISGRFEYGGREGGAQQESNRYRQMGQEAGGRSTYQIDKTQSGADRATQQEMAGLMRARAMGTAPSISQMQADRSMQQAMAAQSSMAAGARGPAGLALAQQGAAANTAAAQGNISRDAQIAAAQERQAAEQAAYGAYSGMRGQSAQEAQAQGQMEQFQRNLNQGAQMGYEGMGAGVNQAQLNARMGFSSEQQQQYQHETGLRHQSGQAAGQLLAGAATAAGGAAMMASDIRAKENVKPLGAFTGSNFAMGMPGAPTKDQAADAHALASARLQHEAAKEASREKFGQGLFSQGAQMMMSDVSAKQGVQPLYSDARAKEAARDEGIRMGAYLATQPGAGIPQGGHPKPPEMMTNDEKMAQEFRAKGMQPGENSGMGGGVIASGKQEGGARGVPESQKPAQVTRGLAAALAPSMYEYKRGMGPPGPNMGPMAQNMAQNPVTAPAVERDPQTGMLALDRDKSLKLALGSAGALAQAQAQQQKQINSLASRVKGRK